MEKPKAKASRKRQKDAFDASTEVWLGGIPPEYATMKKLNAAFRLIWKPGMPVPTFTYLQRRGYRQKTPDGKKIWMSYAFCSFVNESECKRAIACYEKLQVAPNFIIRVRPRASRFGAPPAANSWSLLSWCLRLWLWLKGKAGTLGTLVYRLIVRLVDGGQYERLLEQQRKQREHRNAGVANAVKAPRAYQ